ncbi:MAG: phosphodiester glycosidase family protein [Hyphomonadaceae bacterium]
MGASAPAFAQAPSFTWRALASGLEHGEARYAREIGDGRLHVLRIDPARFRFTLLTGEATGDAPRTARGWADAHDLVAATNAGMFHPGGLPVGFAKADGRVVQPAITRDNSIFVFDRSHARLIDRRCDRFEADDHANALQSIRMVSCTRANTWAQQERRWSIACLAQDARGRILFLHTRSPWSVHDFTEAILAAPLSIARCMYLEGGPEATLYANAGGHRIERFGSYETAFNENDGNGVAWRLPNILGVVAR